MDIGWKSLAIFLLLLRAAIPITSQVTLSPPPGDVCYGDVVELVCRTSRDPSQYLVQSPFWRENMMHLNILVVTDGPYSLQTVTLDSDKLIINITREYFQESKSYSYQCFYVFNNANYSSDESQLVRIDPLDRPNPPALREAVTTTTSTATLKVDHRKTCFQECTFHYEVRVHPADSPTLTSTSSHSTDVLSVSGLTGDTMYRAEIVAVCVGESTIRSDPLTVTFTTMEDGTPPANGEDFTALTAIIVVVCVLVVLALAAIAGVVLASCVVCQRRQKKLKRYRKRRVMVNERKSEVYTNAGVDNRSVPMTTNPGYEQVELSIKTSPVYENF